MQAAQPSRTALAVALRRAAHQIYDRPLVFADPFAVRIVGAYAERLYRTPTSAEEPPERRAWSRGMRAYLVVRSRFAEDVLQGHGTDGRETTRVPHICEAYVGSGRASLSQLQQYLLLGAGLDTFALRNPCPGLRVFEVDHPATQQWKRQLLESAGLTPDVTFVPVDFEGGENLTDRLSGAGFDWGANTAVSWLGVVPYLSLDGFRATLGALSSLPAGSTLVFDYAVARETLNAEEQLQRDSLQARVSQAGEPFTLFLTPDRVRDELSLAGFIVCEDLDGPALTGRYLSKREDGLEVRSRAGRMVQSQRR